MTLELTGIAQETDIASPENSKYFLIFNGGDLRIPVQQAGVATVVDYLNNSPTGGFPEDDSDSDPAAEDTYSDDDDDDGVGQV
jgi:hypothetical protein